MPALLRQKRTYFAIAIALCAVGIAVGAGFWLLRRNSPPPAPVLATLPPLPQHPAIKVYFNRNPSAYYQEPYRDKVRYGDNLEQVLIDGIASATRTLDVAVQELRLPGVAQAIADRQRAGVRVRVILENNYSAPWSDLPAAQVEELDEREAERREDFIAFADLNGDRALSADELDRRDAIRILQRGGVPFVDDRADGSKGSGLMHHKFVVIDGKSVIFGSTNFTMSCTHGDFGSPDTLGNTNHLVRIDSPAVAALFTQEVDILWGDGPGGRNDSRFGAQKPHRPPVTIPVGDARVTVKFSPDSRRIPWQETSNGLIGSTLAQAKRSVDLALFVFAEPRLGNLLEEREKQNVAIRALVDRSFAYRPYATTLDLWGYVSTQDCREGNQKPWAKPLNTVGSAALAKGDKLHHKFGVIDRATVITGSHNWSKTANYTNDETLVILRSPVVAAHFEREFERLYDDATLGPTQKIKVTGRKACSLPPSR